MKFEYKTVAFKNWGHPTPIETSENEINKLLNDLAVSGWEYFHTIAIGSYSFAMIIFRRIRQ